jgi:hemerythrin-like metal-binding protein
VLSETIRYTEYHFAAEAKLMREHGFSDEAGHLRQHKEFVDRMLREQRKVESGELAAVTDLLAYLRDWLVNHILRTDVRLARELNAKGVA